VYTDPQTGGYVQVTFRRPDGRTENLRLPLRGIDRSSRARLATRLLDELRRRLR
jgi:hypothetical protein